jgi:hypothetical protein
MQRSSTLMSWMDVVRSTDQHAQFAQPDYFFFPAAFCAEPDSLIVSAMSSARQDEAHPARQFCRSMAPDFALQPSLHRWQALIAASATKAGLAAGLDVCRGPAAAPAQAEVASTTGSSKRRASAGIGVLPCE